uniref:Myosinlike protein putative n=1 Tax=Albugo laibachii Nc14 TaxID=890382 RepID=F0WWX6_9STRA|nr:myosinlike protein putative [Albugo laibachii Nc14]|eukprot:CCA25961.1 myosinlike protein putative [Albugo laibachii Nc14]
MQLLTQPKPIFSTTWQHFQELLDLLPLAHLSVTLRIERFVQYRQRLMSEASEPAQTVLEKNVEELSQKILNYERRTSLEEAKLHIFLRSFSITEYGRCVIGLAGVLELSIGEIRQCLSKCSSTEREIQTFGSWMEILDQAVKDDENSDYIARSGGHILLVAMLNHENDQIQNWAAQVVSSMINRTNTSFPRRNKEIDIQPCKWPVIFRLPPNSCRSERSESTQVKDGSESPLDQACIAGEHGPDAIYIRQVTMRMKSHANTGYLLWGASLLLARWIQLEWKRFTGKHVLEVGSGLGLAGIVAARYSEFTELTDCQEDTLHALRYNVALNSDFIQDNHLSDYSKRVQVNPLDWNHLDKYRASVTQTYQRGGFDVIIASDIICDSSTADGFVRCIRRLLNPVDGIAILINATKHSRFGVEYLHNLLSSSNLKYTIALLNEDYHNQELLSYESDGLAYELSLLQNMDCCRNPQQYQFPLRIHIKDTPKYAFLVVLKYMYCNDVDEIFQGAKDYPKLHKAVFWKEILATAYRYKVPKLLEVCVRQLVSLIETSRDEDSSDQAKAANAFELFIFVDDLVSKTTHESDLCEKWHYDDQISYLQEKCMFQLSNANEETIMMLLHSETGRKCPTNRILKVLDRRFASPLKKAVQFQLSQVVHELLRTGETSNQMTGKELENAFDVALEQNNELILRRILVTSDAPAIVLTDKRIPVFLLACASGNTSYCQSLVLKRVVNVSETSTLENIDKTLLQQYGYRQTPLHVACRHGHVNVISFLLDHHAELNYTDMEGNTALHLCRDGESAKALIDTAVSLSVDSTNVRGQTPLHIAATNGLVDVVHILLHRGAEHPLKDDQGQTPFMAATAHGHIDVCSTLLKFYSQKLGINVSKDGSATRMKPALISFDINQTDIKSNTALHLAVMSTKCSHALLELLLKSGADPNQLNWLGYTPLHLFCSHKRGPAAVVELLLDWKVDIDAQGLDGNTALHFAVGHASETTAIALVIAGARVDLLDKAGRSVLDLAERTNQGVMIVPLVRNIVKPPTWDTQSVQSNDCASCHIFFTDFIVLEVSAAGFEFQIGAHASWTCAQLLKATETEYRRQFPNCQVPALNVVYNWATAVHLDLNHRIACCCSNFDKVELGFSAARVTNEGGKMVENQVLTPHSTTPIKDDACFDIIFHRLPLGFTLKHEDDGVQVANTYPNTAAMHYRRLVSGVRLIRIGEVSVENFDLRQVHELIKHTEFPIQIRFRSSDAFLGMKTCMVGNNTLNSNQVDCKKGNKRVLHAKSATSKYIHPGQAPEANEEYSSEAQNDTTRQHDATSGRGNVKGLAHTNTIKVQSTLSMTNEHTGRLVSAKFHSNAKQKSLHGRNSRSKEAETRPSGADGGHGDDNAEEYIICRIKSLQKELIKKHEEAKQIALELELYHERLTNIRKTSENIEFNSSEIPKLNGCIKLQLTSEALDHLDKSAGLPPKSGARHNHDNASSVSGYSKNSWVSGKGKNLRSQRRSRKMTREDDASQCSSASSRKSNSRQSTDSRYSYIPQHYSSAPTMYDYPTSLSSRGAVIDRARVNRDSFITRNDVPGVGYYDIKIKDRVKGGEIGDSDRILPWSST